MNGQPTVFRVGASYQRGTSVATSRECFDFFYAQVEAAVNTAASGGGGTARVAASIAEALAGVKAADAVRSQFDSYTYTYMCVHIYIYVYVERGPTGWAVCASIGAALAGVKAADAVSLFVAEPSVFTISKSVAALAAKVLGLGSFL